MACKLFLAPLSRWVKKELLLAMDNYRFNQRVLITGVIIAVIGFIFQIALQQGMRSYARAGIYY
jgi:hypothetical protein